MTGADPGLTMTGDILGTLRYMSPEQASGARGVLDHRTDIHSLGVTLYELVALRPAFAGDDRKRLLRRIVEEEPPPPGHFNKAIPRDLETIILKAIAKEPQSRYATAQQMADDLKRFLEDKPIRAKRPALADRAAKWARRHRTVVWSSVVLLTAASVILAISTLLVLRERTETIRQRDEVLSREVVLRKQRYAADVNWAWQAYNLGETEAARRILDQHRPLPGHEDLRSFAWYHLWQLCQSSSSVLDGHTDVVYCLAFSPDGKTLASGGKDRTVILWDLAAGKPRRTLQGHTDDVNWIAYSPDGKLIATADEGFVDWTPPQPKIIGNKVMLWDPASGRLLRNLTGFEYPVAWVSFVPGTTNLLVAEVNWNNHVGKTSLWDHATGRRLWTIDGWRALSLFPDGRIAASGKGGRILRILDLATQKELARAESPDIVLAAAFSRDGGILATGSKDACVHLWKTADLRHIEVLRGHFGHVRSLVFSPNGRVLVSAGDDGQVRHWDPLSGAPLRVLGGHTDPVWCAAFAPDGSTLATGSSDRSVRLSSGQRVVGMTLLPRQPKAVTGIAFLPDNRTLATASGDSRVRFWDTETGQLASSIELPGKELVCVAVSPSGRLLAISAWDGTIDVRRLAAPDRSIARFQEFGKFIHILAFSPDDLLLASEKAVEGGDPPLSTRLWDLRSGKEWMSLPRPACEFGTQRISFAPDGKTFASLAGADVKLFDLATGELRTLPTGSASHVKCVAHSPDGAILATAGRDPKIKFFDAHTHQLRAVLLGHHQLVEFLAFSSDARTLASASQWGEVKLWDVFTGRELASLSGHLHSVGCLAFSPNGTRLAVGGTTAEQLGQLGEVVVWHAPGVDNTPSTTPNP